MGKARTPSKVRRAKPGDPPKRKRGRPIKGERAGSPHKKRATFKASEPIHVVSGDGFLERHGPSLLDTSSGTGIEPDRNRPTHEDRRSSFTPSSSRG